MASKAQPTIESPSISVPFFPLIKHARRGSIGSLSSISRADKEALNQALDEIHNTASQSGTLTTFNEFTTPPPLSSGTESKSIAGELQGGLSGLYSRFKASVGGTRDTASVTSTVGEIGGRGVDDGSSMKSPSRGTTILTPTAKPVFNSPKFASPTSPTSTIGFESMTRINSPLSGISSGVGSSKNQGQAPNTSTTSFASAFGDLKSDLPSAASGKPSFAPLAQATTSTVASPALNQLSVSAISEKGLHSLETEGNHNQIPRRTSPSAGSAYMKDDSTKEGDRQATNNERFIKSSMQSSNRSHSHEQGFHHTPMTQPSSDLVENNRVTTGRTRESEPNTQKGLNHIESKSVDLGSNGRVISDSLQGTKAITQTSSNPGLPLVKPDGLSFGNQSDSPSSNSKSKESLENEQSKAALRLRLKPLSEIQQPRLPEFSLSRTSSSDTAGASSLNFPLNAKASQGDGSESASMRTLDPVVSKSTITAQATNNSWNMNVVLSQPKGRVLSKEYWMRDENARDCFYCGDPFSTFRRKHHCRTCGQIFDSKCTSLISGRPFGQAGSLRVCKPCEGIINGYDDSSEFSEDGSVIGTSLRPRHGSAGASDISPVSSFTTSRMDNIREYETVSPSSSDAIPRMAIPATRKVGDESNRRSAVLEIDSERRLVRPGSSRSLKSSIGTRPYSSSHKRHYSRQQFYRGPRPVNEERAPFHRIPDDESRAGGRLPAFHSDNIIDPDLAAFLSDEDSSGDEQMSLMTALNGDPLSKSVDADRQGISGLLSSSRKGRSRAGDKGSNAIAFSSRDADSVSSSGMRMAASRSKRRNLSITSNMHLRGSPKAHRFSTASPAVSSHLHESISSSALEELNFDGLRMIRSSSMKGIDAPAVELNNASIQHVRKLLRQLLLDSEVVNMNHWEKALVPILLQATDDVNPDVQHGDDIDIRHYVKLKKTPGGRPGDTAYVSGLVFTKNLALKSMPRSISNPNILILTFPIEYARHQQHFMSLEPVIRQEREFLQNLVHRIAALRPQLLLVERNISGLALEFLEQANIATAYNVKLSVLEAVSRCTQTRIISSIDKLAIKPAQAGKCSSFYLKTYVHGGKKKTYMYLSGCPKELGCTIVLRGGSNETLSKIKKITEFMIYVVYNLKLETCLMRDEFALIPSYTDVGSLSPHKDTSLEKISAALREETRSADCIVRSTNLAQEDEIRTAHSSADVSNADVLNHVHPTFPVPEDTGKGLSEDIKMPDDIPMPTFYGDMVEKHKTKILSASPFVKFMQPYLLMRAREQERRLVYLKRLRNQDLQGKDKGDNTKPQKFVLIKPEMIHETIQGTSKKVREVLSAVHDAEYDKALHNYRTQKRQWEAYIAGNINLFDPYAHQNIAVLYSVVCTVTTVPCSGPDLLALGFYNEHEVDADFEADCTLGQYVEDLCLGANTICTANGCERKMLEHHRQYVHGEAQLSVFVEKHPCKLRGLQDTILMWSTCRICGNDTQVIPMSDSTWKYSFGKYLELSFWSSELHARASVCPHDIHRNHLRYFGFKDTALRIQYDPIKLLEIIVPRTRITWKVANDLRFKNQVFTKTEERLNMFMGSVKARIRSIKVDSVVPEKAEACEKEIEKIMKQACDEHHALLRKLQEKYMDSKYYEIIPLNRAVRAMQEKVAEWDGIFADFDRSFFPSEKDIRRLATLQLRKIFLDRDDSVSSLTSNNEGTSTPTSETDLPQKTSDEDVSILGPQTRTMSPERAHDVLTSVVEENASTPEAFDHHRSAPPTSVPVFEHPTDQTIPTSLDCEDVRHLDLAVSSSLPKNLQESQSSLDSETRAVSPTTMRDWSIDPNLKTTTSMIESAPDDCINTPVAKASVLSPNLPVSGIPRPPDVGFRKVVSKAIPPLKRAHTQPSRLRRDKNSSSGNSTPMNPQASPTGIPTKRLGEPSELDITTKSVEKKLSNHVGVGALKPGGVSTHSMIPRSITRRKESRVSTLAKHFEQLSREFERERKKERQQRAAKNRQARAYPMAASKPIVEIYQNVRDAVEEREPSDEDLLEPEPSNDEDQDSSQTAAGMAQNTTSQTPGDGFHAEDTAVDDAVADYTETDDNTHVDSHAGSDVENETVHSDEEHSLDDIRDIPEKGDMLSRSDTQLDLKLDLPKHEKKSLMKMLTNFWAERSASGWQPLEYPLNASDHVFADSDIIVREDEPSSLIAFALGSEDYRIKLQKIQEKSGCLRGRHDRSHLQDPLLDTDEQIEVERSLLTSTGTHLKYQFQEGSAKMLCKIFYAEQFDAVRRKCGVEERIVESLSRCLKWDSKGGKTKSVFLKTLDDRLVLKSLSQIETQAFLRFAPAYFRIMSEALFHALPSVIAKMLGFYQIVIRNPVTGVEFNWFVLVMENLFYDRSPTRIFDLKGSMRNRRIQSTGEQNEVLLDENMVEFIYESPLFAREHSKKLLRASVYNDTLFLSRQNVMDYSLMIAIDENRQELVVGIIDCIRTYTWDKKLESWIKDRGKNRPTVTSPREYKSRFREAMGRYVLQAPNCWHQFNAQHLDKRPFKLDEQALGQDGEKMDFEQEVGI